DDVTAGRPHRLVELELPVVAREGPPRPELADVRLDRATRRHRDDQLGVGASRQGRVDGRRKGPPEAGVDVGYAEAYVGVAEHLDRRGPPHAERLDDLAAELDHLRVVDRGALDRLAATRLEHRARDRVQ